MTNGKLFNIQRFSIHDGPGIRTTVFLKGCPMRCLWCHNPESQQSREEMFVSALCTGCGRCKKFCEKSFTPHCTACGKCLSVCPSGARQIMGKEWTAEEVFSVVRKDRAYYLTSGGGMTLSGGEPFMQADFCVELLKMCKQNSISTAVETAGCVPWEGIEKALPYLDYILYDIKAMDEEKHKRLTGVSNQLILQNAQKLLQTDINILFRTPVIAGCNEDEPEKIAPFLQGRPYQLMAYNDLGKGKYASLGRTYSMTNGRISDEEMNALAQKCHAFYQTNGV